MTTKEEVKRLWKLCFDDTEEFTELYFKYRYNDDINMLIREEEHLISALQMIPYPMTFLGTTINTAYISGACTDPAYRGKGVMRELLIASFIRMLSNNIPVSTLIPAEPWLFDYYKRMGYSTVFEYSMQEIKIPVTTPASLPGITTEANTSCEEEVYNYLSSHMRERTCYVQHTRTDYEVILADLILSGGKVLSAYKDNNIMGVAIIEPTSKDTLLIRELISDNPEIEEQLLAKAVELYHPLNIHLISPPIKDSTSYPLGMARIINAKIVLDMYAAYYPGKQLNIEVTDNQLAFNNGYYYISNGECTFNDKKIAEPDHRMSANELTGMVFNSLQPYMSLMLN